MDLEPLVSHLEPKFGNFYHYTSWTDELREAVRNYLIDVAPEELYVRFLGHIGHDRVPSGGREKQVDFILDNYLPWGIGAGLHCAAVAITPTLDQLIDQIEKVPSAGTREDAALWLSKHATDEQIMRMVQNSGHAELFKFKAKERSRYRSPDAYDLIEVLTLSELRALWDNMQFAETSSQIVI